MDKVYWSMPRKWMKTIIRLSIHWSIPTLAERMACIGMQFGGTFPEVAEAPNMERRDPMNIPICCICMDRLADFAIYCGHVVQCINCAAKTPPGPYFRCPRCTKRSHFGLTLRY